MIDLATWNLTIPEGEPAVIVSTQTLNQGYQSQFFQRDGSVLEFWVPVTGGTTKGSQYPRSELRQTLTNGKNHDWRYTAANNELSARVAVDQVPSSGKVILGQIHAKNHPYPYVKVVYHYVREAGYVTVEVREKPLDAKSPVVMTYPNMPLGQEFEYEVKLSKSGQLSLRINGLTHQEQINSTWRFLNFYFKAGAYAIDNEGPSTEGARVRFSALSARQY